MNNSIAALKTKNSEFMKPIIVALVVLLFLAGCKKSEEEIHSQGTLVVGETTFEIDGGMKDVSPGSVMIDGQLIPARNITYIFYSNDGKNNVKIRFLTTGNKLNSGEYFINSQSIMISGNTIQANYFLEEDYGQTDRLVVAKGSLTIQKNGELEKVILKIKGDDEVTIKWEGKL